MGDKEVRRASGWAKDGPFIRRIDSGRMPFHDVLEKIIGDVFRKQVQPGSVVFEVGAGLGLLSTLVPKAYQRRYVASDFSKQHIADGKEMRNFNGVVAFAHELPLADNSVDRVVNMDAYDTFPNLEKALSEAYRVLKPGGKFVHFQINYPDDRTVMDDYPDHIFFPARFSQTVGQFCMFGIKRSDFKRGIQQVSGREEREVLEEYFKNPNEVYHAVQKYDSWREKEANLHRLHILLDTIECERIVIPSLPEYWKGKLEKASGTSGFEVVESRFCETTLKTKRNPQVHELPYNYYSTEAGFSMSGVNPYFQTSTDRVIEKAAILVFVARKPKAA